MQAEIIAIGTELLLGATVDTNSAFLARALATVGVPIVRVTLVGDERAAMIGVIREAHQRSDLVICSGGLGPTGDDLTREAIAEALNRPLEFHQTLLDDIAVRFAAFNRAMSPSNRQQAFVPEGAYIIRNPRGTAPAFVVECDGHLVAALPGVPNELQWLTEHSLIPYLREHHGVNSVRIVKEVRVSGISEAAAGERIAELFNLANPVVGITAKGGQHTIRLAATAASTADAEDLLQPIIATISSRFGTHLLGDERLEEQVGRLLDTHRVSLLLRETLVDAPVLRLLQATPGGRAALEKGDVRIAPFEGTVDEMIVRREAETMHADHHGEALALVLLANPQQDATEMTTVHIALASQGNTDYTVRSFDLNIANGYDILGVTALELVRRRLEQMT